MWGVFAVKDVRFRFCVSQVPYFEVCKLRGWEYLVAKGNVPIVRTKPYGVWLLYRLSFVVGFGSKRFRITLCNRGRGLWGRLAVFFCFSASPCRRYVEKKKLRNPKCCQDAAFSPTIHFPWVNLKKWQHSSALIAQDKTYLHGCQVTTEVSGRHLPPPAQLQLAISIAAKLKPHKKWNKCSCCALSYPRDDV